MLAQGRAHRRRPQRRAIRPLHGRLPYSPDFNPIELAFSKLKKLLRDGAQRTVDKLWELCGEILGGVHGNRVQELLQTLPMPLHLK